MKQALLLILVATLQHATVAQAATVAATTLPVDSVACLIVTNQDMAPAFAPYADLKTRAGTPTEIVTTEYITAHYPGDSIQIQVRNCIREYHNQYHTEWVMLGGDVNIIPFMYCWSLLDTIPTDNYYSHLDYNWNEDGDTLFGEAFNRGDSVDYVAEVYLGRLPCSTSAQTTAMLNKMVSYQYDTTHIGYQTEALFCGTTICFEDDVEWSNPRFSHVLLSNMRNYCPANMQDSIYFAEGPDVVKAEMDAGRGLIINCSQAQNGGNIAARWTRNPKTFQEVKYTYFADSMANTGEYSVFFNLTCFNAALTQPNATARAFMLNPTGGGVGYVGAMYYDWSHKLYVDFHERMMELIFQQSVPELGKALALAKELLAPPDWRIDDYRRAAFFNYIYLGDPQMRLWTANPSILICSSPDEIGLGAQTFNVTVMSAGEPVADAKVCLQKGTESYAIAYTDPTGTATFSGVPFISSGIATVVASKHNFFPIEDTIQIVGSCCVATRGNVQLQPNCTPTGDAPDVSDLTALIDYLFISFTPLCCLEESDFAPEIFGGQPDNMVDVGDLTAMIDHLFINFPPMPGCP
ncbi:MAG: hypothetical protein KKA42_10055 [candidate division Zixibacteria bacterium]|nr:hypothetical protein [candidate division Zixibacteria bacterium]